MLAAGRVSCAEIEEAADAEKIALVTLRRAKRALKIRSEKDQGIQGRWYWILPDDGPDDGF